MSNRCIIDYKPAYTQHHILPKSLGGSDDESNLVWICHECHTKIHDSGAINWIDYLNKLKQERDAD
jgi:5-methylcytosine-specific restriction endonuclease McrA